MNKGSVAASLLLCFVTPSLWVSFKPPILAQTTEARKAEAESLLNLGQGRITGDGVIGLSRSFISAGVPSIIVSLWSVSDAPTAELMRRFYENKKTMNKAQALRQAMLETMKTHPKPVDWAAFTLMGEAD